MDVPGTRGRGPEGGLQFSPNSAIVGEFMKSWVGRGGGPLPLGAGGMGGRGRMLPGLGMAAGTWG